jgi:N-acetylmuramoyl-L-alanine amidase
VNRAIILLLIGLVGLTAETRAHGAARTVETARIGGKEYVRLTDWAKANDFEVRWIKKEESLQLVNRRAKIQLAVDSREAQINGVAVRLLFPTVYHEGRVYLAQLDVQSTLHPVLSPPKNRPGAIIKSVCLDPGHGGKDPGYHVGANQEKKYTLLLAQELRQQLKRAGLEVTLTRSTDTSVDLPERPELAKKRSADLFVSLHFNAAPSSASTVQGAEVYCLTPAGAPSSNAQGEGAGAGWFAGNRLNEKNMFLAYQVQKSLAKNLGAEDRGVHRARFAVLRDAVMPAVLIEGGFMSHPAEGRKIFDAAYRREMAKAIVEGLLAYKRAVEQPSS